MGDAGALLALSTGAFCAGFLLHNWFIGGDWQAFWGASIYNGTQNHVLAQLEDVPAWVDFAPTVLGLLGIATAYVMYMAFPLLPMRMAEMFRPTTCCC